MAQVRCRAPTPEPILDVEGAIRAAFNAAGVLESIQPQQRVAIAVGSRGIASLPEIIRTVAGCLKEIGAFPFVVPCMGSHGGATAEGQRDVLRHVGVTKHSVGAPIESDMDTIEIGRTDEGQPVFMDRLAAGSDGIVLVGRIKPHTAFRGPYESGLAKMIAIGLGKQTGAAATHALGFGEMARMIPSMARVALARAPISFGIGILENAREQIFKVAVLPASRILSEEPALLDEARAAMARLPFNELDVLVIDEIGKNISGDGADPNITGRYPTPFASGGPRVTRQVVLDLAEASRGNANGIGTSDFTTVRLARKMDLAQTYPNSLTSTVPGPVKLPMVLPADRLALAAALLTCYAVGRAPRMVRVKNTLCLEEFWISTALRGEFEQNRDACILSNFAPLPFGADGNLPDFATDGEEDSPSP